MNTARTDIPRALRAVARFEADVAAIDDRLATLAAECPDAATFEAHPEVAWQRERRASCLAHVAALAAEIAAART